MSGYPERTCSPEPDRQPFSLVGPVSGSLVGLGLWECWSCAQTDLGYLEEVFGPGVPLASQATSQVTSGSWVTGRARWAAKLRRVGNDPDTGAYRYVRRRGV